MHTDKISLDNQKNCRICTSELETRFSDVHDPQTKETFAVLVCRKCGFGETHPQPENIGDYYTEYYGGRHGFTNDYCARRRVRFLEKSFQMPEKNKRVLDVGCGDGTFLQRARKRGWSIAGTELKPGKFDESHLNIYGDLKEIKKKYGAKSFDAITLWHTLEHFKNPREILENAFELLAPCGVLLIAVPDFDGWQAKIFGKFWLHLDVPRHLFHFNFMCLRMLLAQTGFEIKDHRHQEFEYDLLGWSQSGLNAIFNEPNVFFKSLAGHRTNVNPLIRAANFVFGGGFSVMALPFVLLGNLRQKGGTLVISAVKNKTENAIFK